MENETKLSELIANPKLTPEIIKLALDSVVPPSPEVTARLNDLLDREDVKIFLLREDGRTECVDNLQAVRATTKLIQREGWVEVHTIELRFLLGKVHPCIRYQLTQQFDLLIIGTYAGGDVCAERYNGLLLHTTQNVRDQDSFESCVSVEFKADSVDQWRPLMDEEVAELRALYPELNEAETAEEGE